MDVPVVNSNTSPINIWQARKQQQVILNPAHNIPPSATQTAIPADILPVLTTKSTSATSNNRPRSNQNYNREGSESFRNKNRNRNRNEYRNEYRNKDISTNGQVSQVSQVSREVSKSKNMFSGLESGDSNDEIQNKDDEDEFITVEKKSKNIYKVKKTTALAVEGGKIYSNVSNLSSKSNYSRRS